MDISSIPEIQTFTVNALLITALLCIAAVFTVWYTCRTQIKLSQVIVGCFGYLAYILLSGIMSTVTTDISTGIPYAITTALADVICIEIIRIALIKYALLPRFSNTDSAIGYALGFAGFYLVFSCALYYFSFYTTARSYLSAGAEAFFANLSEEESESAIALFVEIASKSGWYYILTAVNRIFYLLRNVFVSVLIWYSLTDGRKRFWLMAAPIMHFIAILPESLYSAGVFDNLLFCDIPVFVLTGIIILCGALEYKKHENVTVHFDAERLRTRRHRS